MADDDPDDCELTREALVESRLVNQMYFVKDGVELMDFLHHRQQFTDPCNSPRPGLILLDLNMPRKDGREALREIKGDAGLRSIPVVVLTTSKAEIDIYRSYDLGANSYITKPVTFDGLVEIMMTVGRYWFEIVELTSQQAGYDHAEISSQSVTG
jgi:CheY-like chemotaxis protein